MKKIFSDNSYFLYGCLLFFITAGILLSQIETSEELFFLNQNRSGFFDTFFTFFTKMGEEILYGILFIFFLFKKVRIALLIPLIGVAVTLLSFLTKSFFGHDRPKVFLEKNGLLDQMDFIEGVYVHTGQNSFPSGHTMSAFALYGLIAFLIPNKKIWGILLFIIALLVGVSRIYLVQHFLKDVYLGAFFGLLIAVIFHKLQSKVNKDEHHWLNQPIWKKEKLA